MTKNLLTLFATLLFAANAFACLNTYDEEMMGLMSKQDPKELAESVATLTKAYDENPTLEATNDLAVAYVLAGDFKKAIELLRALEVKHPGASKTASNLGTALELSGNNDEALVWIKEGIKRDPKDHKGTEWLHVKILEAKLEIAKNPNWLETNSVLGDNFGLGDYPNWQASVTDYLGDKHSLVNAAEAIEYQLHERLRFVSIPDPLIGDLYFSWADIETLQNPHPHDYYAAALKFGARNQAVIKHRDANYAKNHPPRIHDDGPNYGRWIGAFVLFCIIITINSIFFYRRGRATALKNRPT